MPMRYLIKGHGCIYGGSEAPQPRKDRTRPPEPADYEWDHEGVWARFLEEVERSHHVAYRIDGKEHHMKVWLEYGDVHSILLGGKRY